MGLSETPTFSVHDLGMVIIAHQVGKDVIGVLAAEVTEAGVDPHHAPGQQGAAGTLEVHSDGLGLVGDAAAVVCTDAAVLRPVGPRADAS